MISQSGTGTRADSIHQEILEEAKNAVNNRPSSSSRRAAVFNKCNQKPSQSRQPLKDWLRQGMAKAGRGVWGVYQPSVVTATGFPILQ